MSPRNLAAEFELLKHAIRDAMPRLPPLPPLPPRPVAPSDLMKRAIRDATRPKPHRPPKRPGAAGMPMTIPVGPRPKPLQGGAAVELPDNESTD